MFVGVGDPSHLHTGNEMFEVLYIICDLFCAAVLSHFEMRYEAGSLTLILLTWRIWRAPNNAGRRDLIRSSKG